MHGKQNIQAVQAVHSIEKCTLIYDFVYCIKNNKKGRKYGKTGKPVSLFPSSIDFSRIDQHIIATCNYSMIRYEYIVPSTFNFDWLENANIL